MTTVKHHLPVLAIALLIPIMLLPVPVLVTAAGIGIAVAVLVAVADWAAHDALVVRRVPAAGPVPDAVERRELVGR